MATLRLLALVAAVWLTTAVASPWVAWGLAAVLGRPFTFARVYDRVFEALLALVLVWGWRRLDLGTAAEIGLRRERWARELLSGLAIGGVALAVGLALGALGGAVVPALRFAAGKTAWKALLGLGAAVAVGVGEEVVFRGVLLRRSTRDAGTAVGVVAVTALYAAVHLIRVSGGRAPVTPWSGLARSATLLAPMADPAALPAFVGLLGLGLVLVAARLGSGGLWLPIGIHAAFVAVFRVGRLLFALGRTPAWLVGAGWPPLLGGVAGWAAVAIAALLLRSRARYIHPVSSRMTMSMSSTPPSPDGP